MPSGRSRALSGWHFLFIYRIYRNFGNIHFLDKCEKMRYDCYTDYITGAKNEKKCA